MPRPTSPTTRFRELARLHGRAQRDAIELQGASQTHCVILTELGRAPALSINDLAARLRLDKSWVSRAVDRMVGEGLVRRDADPSDRRGVLVRCTSAGRRHHRRIETILNRQLQGVVARLRPAQRRQVEAALELLHAAYAAELDAAGGRSAVHPELKHAS